MIDVDESFIKTKETLTHERILHDLKHKPLDIGGWILACLLLVILGLMWWLCYHFPLAYLLMIPATICGIWLFVYQSRFFYHDLCAKRGHYRTETDVLDGVTSSRRGANYVMRFSKRGHFPVLEHQQYYTWSKELTLTSHGVAKLYAQRDDVYLLVLHGNTIVMVYNTKLFDCESL